MNNFENQTSVNVGPAMTDKNGLFNPVRVFRVFRNEDKPLHPFRVILNKEISDHVRSWRFIILIAIIALTCLGSMYTALTNIDKAVKPNDPEGTFFLLKLFTLSDGTLPSFIVFMSFLGPLLGISLGFDAVNSEQNNRTLSRILSQPIYRDYLLNAKFLAALVVISVMFFALGFLVMGLGLFTIGIPPHCGRVYADCVLYHPEYSLCRLLVKFIDPFLSPVQATGHFCPGRDCHLALLYNFLSDDREPDFEGCCTGRSGERIPAYRAGRVKIKSLAHNAQPIVQ